MAMLRCLVRENTGPRAGSPPIVVQDELEAGQLVEALRLPDLHEAFWAITLPAASPIRRSPASCRATDSHKKKTRPKARLWAASTGSASGGFGLGLAAALAFLPAECDPEVRTPAATKFISP